MKSGFSDPAKVKKQHPEDHPKDGKNTWWECQQPQYDQRTSCFVNTGTHYGVGYKTPVGHEGEPKMRVPTMPFGRVNTMEVEEIG